MQVKNHLKVIKKCNVSIRKSTRHKDAKTCDKRINSTMKKFKSNQNAPSPKKDIDKKYNQNKERRINFQETHN
jgi:hypothetical protein